MIVGALRFKRLLRVCWHRYTICISYQQGEWGHQTNMRLPMCVKCLHQKRVAGLCEELRAAGWECKCVGRSNDVDCDPKLPYVPGGHKYWYVKKSDTKFKTWYMRALLICSQQSKQVAHLQTEAYYKNYALGFPTDALGRSKFKFRGDVKQEDGDAPKPQKPKVSRARSKREDGGEPKPKSARGAGKKEKKEPIAEASGDDDHNDSDSDSSDSSSSSSGNDSLPSPSPLSTSDDDPPEEPGSDTIEKAGTSAKQEREEGGPGEPPDPSPPPPHPVPRPPGARRQRAAGAVADHSERDTSRADDTIYYKKFRWTGTGPRSNRLGWEVTCYRKSHTSVGLNGQKLYCTRSLRFSAGGGESKTRHFLKWWCVQGFECESREDHMALPRVLPARPPSERVLDLLMNQPASDTEPEEGED